MRKMSIAGGNQRKQPRKALVQFAPSQRGHALRAIHFCVNHSRGAQHFKMMGSGRLRYAEANFVAGQRAAFGAQQFTDDGQPARIRQRLHHCGQRNLVHRRMAISFHNTAPCHQKHGSTIIELFLTSTPTDTRFDICRTINGKPKQKIANLENRMPNLFDPVRIGAWSLPNRIVLAPLTRARAGAKRIPNALMAEYYVQRAAVGLIISEATSVTPMGVGYADTPGIWSAAQVDGWKLVTDAVHKAGGRMVLQLWHVGRISDPQFLNGALPVAPSAIAAAGHVSLVRPPKAFVTPRALELQEIPGISEAYRLGAENAKLAGFD